MALHATSVCDRVLNEALKSFHLIKTLLSALKKKSENMQVTRLTIGLLIFPHGL